MKREGRQHGMVRTFQILPSPRNPRPESRLINSFDSPPTAGLFTKVQPKPTNHSKFTGKCGRPRCAGCHEHPACKAKDKTKGTQKLKSCDVVSNYRLVTWRVVDGRPGLNFSGFSATGILDHLGSDYMEDDFDDGQHDVADDDLGREEEIEMKEIDEHEDEDDNMSFCDVGFVLNQVEGDEDWCLVGEM